MESIVTNSSLMFHKAILCVVTALLISCWADARAQDSDQGRVTIDVQDTFSGNLERSQVAWACTRVANASIFAHENNIAGHIANEAAKFRSQGASEDSLFNNFIETFQLNPRDSFLFPALIFSQTNIMYLEEKSPYRSELKPIYTAYLAAECARVAKFSRDH